MKRAIKQLYQKKVSELTVEEFISTIQYAVSGNTKESLPVIPKEIACVDENFYRMMQEHPEKYIIGMKALSMLLGCSIRKAHDLRLIFNKELVMNAYSDHGMYLKGKLLRNKILEYKATAL